MLAHDRRHAFGPWVFAAAAAYFLLHLYNILYMLCLLYTSRCV